MTSFLYRTRIESDTLVSHPSVHRIAPFRHHIALAPLVRYDVGRVRYDVRKDAIRVSQTWYECDTWIMPWYPIIIIFTQLILNLSAYLKWVHQTMTNNNTERLGKQLNGFTKLNCLMKIWHPVAFLLWRLGQWSVQ